jgi:hypothetical protein
MLGKRTGATQMIVLSALAEGADQLVAQVAVERGLRVIAPLPLPVEEYRRDFELQPVRPDALTEFDAWMARPGIQKLFVGYEKGCSLEAVRTFGEKRSLQYRRAGVFIVRHCDVLIALWDGTIDQGTGGTAEVVHFKRHGIPLDASGSARASLDAPEMGPVIHIVTPRAIREGTATAVSVPSWGAKLVKREIDAARKRPSAKREIDALKTDHRLWEFFQASIKQSRKFNRAAVRLLASEAGRTKVEQSFLGLFDGDEKKPGTAASELRASAIAPRYCNLYAVVDTLAQNRQQIFLRDWRWLFGLSLFAFGCFEAFSHLAPIAHHQHERPGMTLISRIVDLTLLFGYMAAFIAIFTLYPVAILGQHQERFLDYRALAEALRVTVFWRLGGIEGAADAYPIKMPRELAWVKTCLLMQELLDKATPAGAAPTLLNRASYDWIRRIWIKGQFDWFTEKALTHFKAARLWARWSTAFLFVVAAFTAGLFALVLREATVHGEPIHDLFLFAMGILPGIAAIFVGYSEKLAFDAQARQYDRMAEVFGQADAILPPTLDAANINLVRDTVRELGVEVMRDNAEWVSTYRQRPISLPQS